MLTALAIFPCAALLWLLFCIRGGLVPSEAARGETGVRPAFAAAAERRETAKGDEGMPLSAGGRTQGAGG